MSDGLEEGLVLSSQYSAYTEVFLFETAVNLCRNASSLTSTFDLREAYHQLSREHSVPLSLEGLRSLPVFRTTMLLYIYLVIVDLPLAVSTCAVCARADGSLRVICLDGLQMGFKLRFRTPFSRVSVKLRPIARASIIAHVISDKAVSRALGSVLTAGRVDHEAIRAASVKTVTAVREHVMALAILSAEMATETASLAGQVAHAEQRLRQRGWDLFMDGGAHPSVVVFFRELFRCGRAARKLALTIAGASETLWGKVPRVLMRKVHHIIAAGDAECSTDSDSGTGSNTDGASDLEAIATRPRARRRHLPRYARAVADPVLVDAGGVAGEERRGRALLCGHPKLLSTADSAEKLLDLPPMGEGPHRPDSKPNPTGRSSSLLRTPSPPHPFLPSPPDFPPPVPPPATHPPPRTRLLGEGAPPNPLSPAIPPGAEDEDVASLTATSPALSVTASVHPHGRRARAWWDGGWGRRAPRARLAVVCGSEGQRNRPAVAVGTYHRPAVAMG